MKKKNLRRSTRQRGTDTTEESKAKKNCKPTDWMKQKKSTHEPFVNCSAATGKLAPFLFHCTIIAYYIWWCCRQRRYFHPIALVFVCLCECVRACERQMKRFWTKEKSERKKWVIALRLMQSPKFSGVAKSRCQAKWRKKDKKARTHWVQLNCAQWLQRIWLNLNAPSLKCQKFAILVEVDIKNVVNRKTLAHKIAKHSNSVQVHS